MNNPQLTLPLSGRVDSANAAAVEAELMQALGAKPHSALTLDCETLDLSLIHISSSRNS